MTDEGQEPEDFLRERLNEAASGDTAVRQLRRRYDLLRTDYEQLLDRLGELEERLNDAADQAEARPPTPVAASLAEAIAAPLLRLRDDYLSAVVGIQNVVTGLEGLASGFKGQHRAQPQHAAGTYAPRQDISSPAETHAEQPSPRTHRMQVDVKGSGFGELLDFQERLSHVSGVSRVSISAIDNERATLVVELNDS